MDNTCHISLSVSDRSYLAIIKKEIHEIAAKHDFGKKKLAEIDIVVAEIASNLTKHAKDGEILIRVINTPGAEGIELIGIDHGPGMKEPLRMVDDGVSTKNTLGQGLGAIKRLSDTFGIYSKVGWGTILLSRIYRTPKTALAKKEKVEIGYINVPKPTESFCGDGFYALDSKDSFNIFVGDGLGHGEEANKAVVTAIQAFKASPYSSAVDNIKYIHKAIAKTRGAVGTVATYSYKEKVWRICGIGNISNFICFGGNLRGLMSYNGVLGMTIPTTLKDNIIEKDACQYLMLASDGLKNKWELSRYPGIFQYDLSILAAALYKDYARKTDDMSVMVIKLK